MKYLPTGGSLKHNNTAHHRRSAAGKTTVVQLYHQINALPFGFDMLSRHKQLSSFRCNKMLHDSREKS